MKVKKIIKKCNDYEWLLIADTDGIREVEGFAYDICDRHPYILEMKVQNIRSIIRHKREALLLTGNFSEVLPI